MHIANFQQNRDFESHTKLITEEGHHILKLECQDPLTYFRIHHEIDDMKRRKEDFERSKKEAFLNKNPDSLIKYDRELDTEDAEERPKARVSINKESDLYKFAKNVAERLKVSVNKQYFIGEEELAMQFLNTVKEMHYNQGNAPK
jgi:hypothetical protein